MLLDGIAARLLRRRVFPSAFEIIYSSLIAPSTAANKLTNGKGAHVDDDTKEQRGKVNLLY